MSTVIDFAAWRRGKGDGSQELTAVDTDGEDPLVTRLEEAIHRLQGLVSLSLDGRGRLQPKVETELLAIMGELTVGLVTEAVSRAERLADRLAATQGVHGG